MCYLPLQGWRNSPLESRLSDSPPAAGKVAVARVISDWSFHTYGLNCVCGIVAKRLSGCNWMLVRVNEFLVFNEFLTAVCYV